MVVVAFEVAAVVAAGDAAFAPRDEHRGLHFGGDVAAEVRDGGDVFALLDDRGEERVAEQPAGVGDVDGPDAGDLAAFAGQEVAAHEGGVVDDRVQRVGDGHRGRVVVFAEDRVGERVGGVGGVRFVLAGAAMVAEAAFGVLVEAFLSLAPSSGASRNRPASIPSRSVHIRSSRACAAASRGRGRLRPRCARAGTRRVRRRAPVDRPQQVLFRGWVVGERVGDHRRLRRRQAPVPHRQLVR